ncbi:MAG TPA: hypothetical protein VFJ85_01110 [Acidimicrobiales bacterium]|nr:hypothetical protein [Acidimicrobiales bacterium]
MAAIVVAVAIGTVVVRRRLERRALRARVRFALVPSESFDPQLEDVLRFASVLTRTRRAVGRGRPRRVDAIRLRLVAIAGGRVVQFLEGPKNSLSLLRLNPYPEVDLRPPESVLPALDAGPPERPGQPQSEQAGPADGEPEAGAA